MSDFSPREIVSELDRFVVGHAEAKRAVAVALRNRWRRQRVPEALRFYLAARLAAFICEYLIQTGLGERVVEDGRILMRTPIRGLVQREFDPYAVAIAMATNRLSLKVFLFGLLQ